VFVFFFHVNEGLATHFQSRRLGQKIIGHLNCELTIRTELLSYVVLREDAAQP
jgi:hypothetical protein